MALRMTRIRQFEIPEKNVGAALDLGPSFASPGSATDQQPPT